MLRPVGGGRGHQVSWDWNSRGSPGHFLHIWQFFHLHDAQKYKQFLCNDAGLRHFAAAKCKQAMCGSADPDGVTDWSVGHHHIPESVKAQTCPCT
eukprot:1161019-Pelagomonas_calceolata.AAC.5